MDSESSAPTIRAKADALSASSTSIERRTEIFRAHPFFAALSESDLRRVIDHARPVHVPVGSTVFNRGDEGRGCFAVISGAVKIGLSSPDGREITLNAVQAGGIFGEIALMDGGPRSADAVALTPCELLFLDRRDFLVLVHESMPLALKLIELLCARLRRTSEQVEDVAFLDVSTRLAKALLHLSDGSRPVRITQTQLANIVGTSRETTNRQLRDWVQRGWIRLGKGLVVVLDRASLSRIAGSRPEM